MSFDLSIARDFLAQDVDADSRAALSALIDRAAGGDADADAELADAFLAPLQFGTAGLRGRVGPGVNRMNRVVVIAATWGLGTYLKEQFDDAAERGVVIGFDGRRTSRQFAEDAAAVLAGLGIQVHLFDDITATPTCAFAVPHLNACAGIMVTASHNPPDDNGYKVYWANGAQIIPPHDKGIAACIARAPKANDVVRPSAFEAAQNGLRHVVADDVTAAYLQGVDDGRLLKGQAQQDVHVVYTAMHGVGHPLVIRALRNAGVHGVTVVPSQTEPDGAFPTVAFPNPEEAGALDRAFALATEVNADVVVANDPDADRLAVAIPDGNGGYRQFSGNEVGALLGHTALQHADVGSDEKLVVTTLVSSTLLSRMASDLGAAYKETLTGFKWIANTALDEKPHHRTFVFGYEEALGYSVGELVRDKDGVSAVVHLVELARMLKAQGKTLQDALDDIFVAHGLSVSLQYSHVLPGADGKARIDAVMEKLRQEGLADLDGSDVVKTADLKTDVLRLQDGSEEKTGFPTSNVLVFHSAEGTRLTVRPSGTEPKVKFYLETVAHVDDVAALAPARETLGAKCARIRETLDAALGL